VAAATRPAHAAYSPVEKCLPECETGGYHSLAGALVRAMTGGGPRRIRRAARFVRPFALVVMRIR